MLKIEDNVSGECRDEVARALKNFPDELHYLNRQGVICDVDHVAKYEKRQVRGNVDSRDNLYQYRAWFEPDQNKVVLNEHTVSKKGNLKKVSHIDGSVRHEYGHAFDWNVYDRSDLPTSPVLRKLRYKFNKAFPVGRYDPEISPESTSPISESPSFKRAYEADLAKIGGVQAAIDKGFGYFVSPGKVAGFHEVFAEQFADQKGGGIIPNLAENFPHTRQWMAEFLQGHALARARSPQAVRQFVKDFGETGQLSQSLKMMDEEFPCYPKSLFDLGIRAGMAQNYETIQKRDGEFFLRTKLGAFDQEMLKVIRDAVNAYGGGYQAQILKSVRNSGIPYMAIRIPSQAFPHELPDIIGYCVNKASLNPPAPPLKSKPVFAPF